MSENLTPTEAELRASLATLDAAIGALYEQRKTLVDRLYACQEREKARSHYTAMVAEAAGVDLPGLATP